MLAYETYMNTSFNLGTGTAATNFIRSEFDYGARQRRAVKGYDTFNARLVLTNAEMTNWVSFWTALDYGTDSFTTNEVINHDETTGKTCRFTSGYQVQQIGADKFIVTVPLELISTGA